MVQLFLCGFVEVKRWQDFRKPGSQADAGTFLGMEASFKGVENGYPGGAPYLVAVAWLKVCLSVWSGAFLLCPPAGGGSKPASS